MASGRGGGTRQGRPSARLALGHLKLFTVQADGYIIVLCHKGCNFSTQNHVHSLLFMEYFVMQKFYFLILNPYSFCLYAMPREYFFTPRKHKCCTHLCLVL